MKTVGLRELKNRLSAYVRQVRAGHGVLVTDRGQVVAELVPPRSIMADVHARRGLASLARRGVLSLGTRNDPKRLPRGKLKRLLDEERGVR